VQRRKRHESLSNFLLHSVAITGRRLSMIRIQVRMSICGSTFVIGEQKMPMSGRLVTVAALAVGGLLLSKQMKKRGSGSESSVEESIVVNVPVNTAYNQWTQFEEFPKFMDSVQDVKQLDDTHLHWRASIAGRIKEWDSEITEQIPDQRIAWRSTSGARNSGVVTFHNILDSKTRVVLHVEFEPETVTEKIGDAVGGVKHTAKANLKRFKDLIERRGVETGAWRGTVTQH
jgi:uncharacterized membrane protein